MSTRQWNTVAERDALIGLMDLCMAVLEDEEGEDIDDLDGDDSLLSDDDADEIGLLFDLTMEYGQ
jgi:hypothetical protein